MKRINQEYINEILGFSETYEPSTKEQRMFYNMGEEFLGKARKRNPSGMSTKTADDFLSKAVLADKTAATGPGRPEPDMSTAEGRRTAELRFGEKKANQAIEMAEIYLRQSLDIGERDPKTVAEWKKLITKRQHIYRQIDPINLRREFMTTQGRHGLELTETESELLQRGKASPELLGKYATRFSEYTALGHLPGRLSTGTSGRVARFGKKPLDPGAFYIGMFDNGNIMSIPEEQQKGFIEHVFGRTKIYRSSETGEIIHPRQMSKVRVIASDTDKTLYGEVATKEKFGKHLDTRIRELRTLASQEKRGLIEARETINPYIYSPGKPGRRKPSIQAEDESTFFERLITGEREDADKIHHMRITKPGSPDLSDDVNKILEEAHTGGHKLSSEQLSALAEKLTGISENAESQGISLEEASKELDRTASSTVESIKREGYYQKELNRLKAYKEMMYNYKNVRVPGQKKLSRVRTGFSDKFSRYFDKAIASVQERIVNLSGKPQEEIESILDSLGGQKLQTVIGKRRHTLVEEPIETLWQMPLMDIATKSIKTFKDINNPVDSLAMADQVIEIFFKKNKGKKTFTAHTAAGAVLGETSPDLKKVPAKAYAKIFEYNGRYEAAFELSPSRFYTSRYDAIPGEEINSAMDIKKERRLRRSEEYQKTLERVREQSTREDQLLIAKYRRDRATNKMIDVETGGIVDDAIADTYFANIEKKASRRIGAVNRLSRMKTRTSKVSSGKMEAALGKASGNKGMVIGALAISSALVSLSAFSSKNTIRSEKDVNRESYGSMQDSEAMFQSRPDNPPIARITKQGGYTTNIDVSSIDDNGNIDYNDLSRVMHRHVSGHLRTTKNTGNMEISDNSDRRSDRHFQRKYDNMLR